MNKEELSKLYRYDKNSPSGLVRVKDWVSGRNGSLIRAKSGSCVGGLCSLKKYYNVLFKNKLVRAHVVIWILEKGNIPEGFVIDHIDGCTTNNEIQNLRSVPIVMNTRNKKMRTTNNSGVCGVCFCDSDYPRWVTSWSDLQGKQRSKSFSITKYGNDDAFKLACDYRAKIIDELNLQGANYTERHGK